MSLTPVWHGPGVDEAFGPRGLQLVTPPAMEVVSLAETKAYLRVEAADEDALIDRLTAAARRTAEQATGRAFVNQSWRLTLDRWPVSGVVELPLPPLVSVDAVVIVEESGTETVWAAVNTVADTASEPGRLTLRDGVAAPVPGREIAGLAVDFTAGYGPQPTDVPEPLRQAVIRLAAYWFENRNAARAGTGALPAGIEALLAPWRVVQL